MSYQVHHEGGGSPYAGFWRRVIAFIIDQALTIPFLFVGMYLAFGFGLEQFTGLLAGRVILNPAILMWYAGASAGIILYYHMAFESSSWQATPGKLLLGIKVTDSSGVQIGMIRAVFRAWPLWLSGVAIIIAVLIDFHPRASSNPLVLIVMLLSLVACVVVAFTQTKQGLHDMMAGTLIVRRGAIFEDEIA